MRLPAGLRAGHAAFLRFLAGIGGNSDGKETAFMV